MSSEQFEHIQRIRQDFYASERLKASTNSSIRALATDLYKEDIHFIFELIQNAEDNTYKKKGSYPPYISFELTKTDPIGTPKSDGALIIRNNEIGFSSDNVDAICAVGQTTKKKEQGYIGEKGIGFKSVFRVTENPHIFPTVTISVCPSLMWKRVSDTLCHNGLKRYLKGWTPL